MKNNLFLMVLLALIFSFTCRIFSQTDLIPYHRFEYKKTSKWGFCDKNKNIVITPKYDFVQPFSEGRALVSLNEKYGFIDEKGNEVISIKYDIIYLPHGLGTDMGDDFIDGLARVKLNGKWGFINRDGKEIVPVKYDSACRFEKGLAKVRLIGDKSSELEWGMVNTEGEEVLPPAYTYIESINDGFFVAHNNLNCGLVNNKGKLITEMIYNHIGPFVEGLAIAGIYHSAGFMNKEGKIVIPVKYDFVSNFHNGIARVSLRMGETGMSGFIDLNGNEYWGK
jgi:hypothetical protein